MKINIRHEPPTDPEGGAPTAGQSCIWIVSDNGVVQSTCYLQEGEQVSIDVETRPAVTAAQLEAVQPIADAVAAPPPA